MIRIRKLSLAACAGLQVLSPDAAIADGEFYQLDASPDRAGLVLAVTRDKLSLGANHFEYEGGSSSGVSITYATTIDRVGTLRFGPSLGFTSDAVDNNEVSLGARVTMERWSSTDFGHIFFLGEVNSIDDNWFGLSQFGFRSLGFTLEISAGGSVSYNSLRLVLMRRLGDSPVYLRLGQDFVEGAAFAGIAVNTF